MLTAYDGLVKSGAIGSLKRDILLEASDDLFYLCHIRKWFEEEAGAAAAKEAIANTVRVVRELIDAQLCELATWGPEKGSIDVLQRTDEQIRELVERYSSPAQMPFDFFVVVTGRGEQWVTRYNDLVNELQGT